METDFVQHQALKTDSRNHREPNRPFSSKTLASKHILHKFHRNALCLLIRLDRIHTCLNIQTICFKDLVSHWTSKKCDLVTEECTTEKAWVILVQNLASTPALPPRWSALWTCLQNNCALLHTPTASCHHKEGKTWQKWALGLTPAEGFISASSVLSSGSEL